MPEQTLPPGRLVYGHPSKLIAKTDNKRQPVLKDGKPVMVRSFGVAYPKDVFMSTIWPIMYQAASSVFGGQQPPPHFSYKFKDGDGVDRQGRPYNQREGYAGHCVIHFETQFDLNAYRRNPQTGGWDQIGENDYKTGDYIEVNCSIEGNKPTDPTHTPGLFINPKGVLHVGNGTAIINAPSADQMFGNSQPSALPPGALPPSSVSPTPAGMANPPGFGGAPAMPPAAQPAPGGYAQPPAVPGAPAYPPAHDIYAAPQAPAAPQYAPPPAAAAPAGYPPAHDIYAAPQAPAAPQYAPPPAAAAPAGYPPQPGGVPPMPPGAIPGR